MQIQVADTSSQIQIKPARDAAVEEEDEEEGGKEMQMRIAANAK